MNIIPVIEAAKRGNEDQIAELIRNGANPNKCDSTGCNALHWAAGGGHNAAVSVLIRHRCDVNKQNLNGDTPLHKAAWKRHPQCVQLLLNAGANRDIENKEGKPPLMLVRDIETRKLLVPPIEGSDDEMEDEDSD